MTKITVVQDDITKQNTDCIVNAANKSLLGGGGVDGAINRAAGPELLEECRGLCGCRTGEAKITKGYKIPVKYIIHTVGPIYGQEHGNEKTLLAGCYINSLKLAKQYKIRTIAFPAISTGIYGYPKEEAVHVVKEAISTFLKEDNNDSYFDEIRFVLHNIEDKNLYDKYF